MKENDKWVENLRNKLEDYSEPLPGQLWGKLEEELSAPRVIPMWRTRRFVAAAAAVAVVAVSSLMFWFVNSPTADYVRDQQPLAEGLEQQHVSTDILPNLAEEKNPSVTSRPILAVVTPVAEKVCQPAEVQMMTNDFEKTVPENERESTGEENKKEENVQSAVTKEDMADKERAYRTLKADRRQLQQNQEMLMAVKTEKGRKWSVGISAGNTPYASSRSFEGMSRLNSRSLYASPINMAAVSENDNQTAYSQVLFNNRDRSTTTNVHHKMPVTVGASVKWHITDGWAVESGLYYTMLSSELHSGSNSYLVEEQKLHYVGIPLKVHRSIWDSRWLSFYASAGGMVEKCVSGGVDVVYVNGTSNRNMEHNSLDVDPLQWSVSAAAGVQVNFTKNIGLYAEPGIAYYFDDGSEVETIRKEHPFNFNLQVGLRFSIK